MNASTAYSGSGHLFWDSSYSGHHRSTTAGVVVAVRRVTADGLVTSFAHDEKGSLSGVTYPSGESYSFTHDEHGNLTGIHGAHGWLWRFEYDARHNLVAETDGRGARTTYTHDGMDRPVTRTGALGRTTRVTYDRGGRVARIDDARWGTTVYAHDKVDQLVEARRGAYREVFEYDAAGSLVKMLQGLDAEPHAEPAWEIRAGNLVTRTSEAKYFAPLRKHYHPPAPPKPRDGPSRKGPCPCGSGEKYKRCCGKSD
jgi:YD repeat-containing protein